MNVPIKMGNNMKVEVAQDEARRELEKLSLSLSNEMLPRISKTRNHL